MRRDMRRGRAQSTTPGYIETSVYNCMLKVIFSGKVEKRNYTKGELNGPATITWQTGDVFEFSYKNGNMEVTSDHYNQSVRVIIVLQGNAVFHSHTGLSEQRSYVDGVCHGPGKAGPSLVNTLNNLRSLASHSDHTPGGLRGEDV